ncbi:Transcriptional regulator KdgR [compost metagenome]
MSEAQFQLKLQQVREQGFALDDQEIVEGARCLAAPIFNIYGNVEGAVSMSGAMHRFADEVIPEMAESIKAAANRISQKLGYETVH